MCGPQSKGQGQGLFTVPLPPLGLLLLLERRGVSSVNLFSLALRPSLWAGPLHPLSLGATSPALPSSRATPQPGSPCPSPPGLQPCTSSTPHIPCPPGPAKTPRIPDSRRGIPARWSLYHICIYWQNLFPGIEGTGACRVGWVTSFSSVQGAEKRRGQRHPRQKKPAANIY